MPGIPETFAEVVREAITCDRPECTPEQHAQFVTDNLRVAQEEVRTERGESR